MAEPSAAQDPSRGSAPSPPASRADALRALAQPPQLGFTPRRWRAWWRWWWYFGRHRRRVDQLRVAFGADLAPDCAACLEHCCKAPAIISLRLADIARLHDAGLGWAVVPFESRPRQSIYASHPELAHFEQQDVIRRFPVLQQGADGRCVFVDDHNRCTIYAMRPAVCRRFPALLGADLESVRWAAFCTSRRPDPAAHAQLVAAVAAHHNAKLLDLWLIDTAWSALERLGLTVYLPDGARRVRAQRFADVVAKRRAKQRDTGSA